MKNKISHIIIALVLIVSLSTLPTASILAQVTYTSSQDVTSYVSAQGEKTHSGALPFQGGCAVHPWTSIDPGNGPGQFPFGATAQLSQSVPMYPGNSYRSIFTVNDTGDYGFLLTRSFIDVWQGTDNYGGPIWTWCRNVFGQRKADITFYY